MRWLLVLLTLSAVAFPAAAQTDGKADCTDIQAGTATGYTCINRQLQAIIQQTPRPSSAGDAPYDATSPSNVTGQFNEEATRNRLGANFGKSVTPQRPTITYVAPLNPRP
jgi:hypothetical protein